MDTPIQAYFYVPTQLDKLYVSNQGGIIIATQSATPPQFRPNHMVAK